MTEYYYRIEDTREGVGGINIHGEWEPGHSSRPCLWLEKFPVIKRTPKGVKIDVYSFPKFIGDDWFKKYAYPTIDEAVTSFRRRKAVLISIAKARIIHAKEALALLDKVNITANPDTLDIGGRFVLR